MSGIYSERHTLEKTESASETANEPVKKGDTAEVKESGAVNKMRTEFAALAVNEAFARAAAAARRRQEHLVVGQRRKQRRTAFGRDDLLAAVDVDRNFARQGQFGLCKEKQPHQQKGHHQKGNDCNYNSQFHFFRISFKVRTEYPRRS